MRLFALTAVALITGSAYVHAQDQQPPDPDFFQARYFCYHGDQRYSLGARIELGSEQSAIVQTCGYEEAEVPDPNAKGPKYGTVKAVVAKWTDVTQRPPAKK
jgi:hypothetical protein